jgi:hypothetical protein
LYDITKVNKNLIVGDVYFPSMEPYPLNSTTFLALHHVALLNNQIQPFYKPFLFMNDFWNFDHCFVLICSFFSSLSLMFSSSSLSFSSLSSSSSQS